MRYVPASQDGSPRDENWVPLERAAECLIDQRDVPPLIPCEFAYFGYAVGPRGTRIYEYKHLDSRRCVQLTLDGRVARYVPPAAPGSGSGRYVVTQQSVKAAVTRLEIDGLAGMRPRDWYCDSCRALLDRRAAAMTEPAPRPTALKRGRARAS